MISFSASLQNQKHPVLLPVFDHDLRVRSRIVTRYLSPAQKKAVRQSIRYGLFPKAGLVPLYCRDQTVFLCVIENKKSLETRDIRNAAEVIVDALKRFRVTKLSVLPGSLTGNFLLAFREELVLGMYEFQKITAKKDDAKNPRLSEVHFVATKHSNEERDLTSLYEGLKCTKDLVNMPPDIATPSYVVHEVESLARKSRKFSLCIFEKKELAKMKCGGILAVARASSEEPRMIVLEYRGGGKEAPIALVGKGVTYDSGGLFLKIGQSLRFMKQDLAGAATILGALLTSSLRGLKKNVVAVLPVVENLINEQSYKVDDVLSMHNGKTVEVTNTDAEGRLILADALSYTENIWKPRALIDLATLTGGAFLAVGDDLTALMSNNPALCSFLKTTALAADEPVWELPLHQSYLKHFESKVADIVNYSPKMKARTIEGGLFLQHFVGEKTPWCHLDIASVAFDEIQGVATGRNVRMLVRFLESY